MLERPVKKLKIALPATNQRSAALELGSPFHTIFMMHDTIYPNYASRWLNRSHVLGEGGTILKSSNSGNPTGSTALTALPLEGSTENLTLWYHKNFSFATLRPEYNSLYLYTKYLHIMIASKCILFSIVTLVPSLHRSTNFFSTIILIFCIMHCGWDITLSLAWHNIPLFYSSLLCIKMGNANTEAGTS